ncbi:uncharacterized protein EI90DRAFT_3036425 [Cantharellus anzutake]|uniref:uncharacterized protein n=1 Tax=Cantharellus anzutake TaxID=1750568 RepID=UPI0019059B92|nr:uncharacterized protein EI90DRAFT_3036425 [Cantharellus anzutake]KAF8340672.1 hypothetical protein EI90DRAFT_3036425 [Cantharellus anzutake]
MDGLYGVVYSLGHEPSAEGIGTHLTSPMPKSSSDICCQGLITLLRVLYDVYLDFENDAPKLVVVSSMGVGQRAFQQLPVLLRLIFSHFLRRELQDKLAMEVVLSQCLVRLSTAFRSTRYVPRFFPFPSEVSPSAFPLDASNSLPRPFLLPPEVCVVRPALLTSGSAKGRGRYRVVQEDKIKINAGWWGMYSISREDVGGFIADLFNPFDDWTSRWWGHQVVLAY